MIKTQAKRPDGEKLKCHRRKCFGRLALPIRRPRKGIFSEQLTLKKNDNDKSISRVTDLLQIPLELLATLRSKVQMTTETLGMNQLAAAASQNKLRKKRILMIKVALTVFRIIAINTTKS